MNIYELNATIEALEIKLEAYEGSDEERVELLKAELQQMEGTLHDKRVNCLNWRRNMKAYVAALKNEKRDIAAKQKTAENKLAWLNEYIEMFLFKTGETFESGVHKISWRKKLDELEIIEEEERVPEEFVKVETSYRKSDIKKFLKENGNQVWAIMKEVAGKTISIR